MVEKDYILNHVLTAIAEARLPIVFRGGSALARCYWPDFRMSEDLDFVARSDPGSISVLLDGAVATAAERTGRSLQLETMKSEPGWFRSRVAWDDDEVLIDMNGHERLYLPTPDRGIDLPYSDLSGSVEIAVVSLEEILGNKWFMLDDREEPRDLFDVWAGLCRFRVPFERLAVGHRAKYGYPPVRAALERSERLRDLWRDRLQHQVAELADFDEVYSAVRTRFEEWAEDR